MFLETGRFGNIEIAEEKTINFSEGIPGFEKLKRFVLLQSEETKPVCWLQSLDDGNVSLSVIDPFLVLDDYSLDVGERELLGLKVKDAEDIFVVNVVVIPEDIRNITINLAAPIIINVPQGLGKQIVIENCEYPTRYPMFKELCKILDMQEGVEGNAGTVPQAK